MKKFKKTISIILSCVAACCLIAAVFLTIRHFMQDAQAEKTLEELRNSADQKLQETLGNVPTDISSTGISSTVDSDSNEEDSADISGQGTMEIPGTPNVSDETLSVPNPYAENFLANPDMAAWLVIPDTVIDYPVMWTPEDETYYLYRDFEGNDNQNGCLLLDTDSCLNPLTTNLIIHGHNMKSGAMFGNLTDYEDEDFYEQHKQIILYTEDCRRNYEVIAVFRSQVYKKTDQVFKFYQFFQADTEEEFDSFYENIKALSLYDTGVTAEFGDHFITLSTCVYHVPQGRFVVVAKEVESGDTYLPVRKEVSDTP
ncbi:MAG: class B sortase [Lachnospiraceae bacterium]